MLRLDKLVGRTGQLPDRFRDGAVCNRDIYNTRNHGDDKRQADQLAQEKPQIIYHLGHLDIHTHITGRFSRGGVQGVIDAHKPAEFLIADDRRDSLAANHARGVLLEGARIIRLMIAQGDRVFRWIGIHNVPDFIRPGLDDIEIFCFAVRPNIRQDTVHPLVFLVPLTRIKVMLNPIRVNL